MIDMKKISSFFRRNHNNATSRSQPEFRTKANKIYNKIKKECQYFVGINTLLSSEDKTRLGEGIAEKMYDIQRKTELLYAHDAHKGRRIRRKFQEFLHNSVVYVNNQTAERDKHLIQYANHRSLDKILRMVDHYPLTKNGAKAFIDYMTKEKLHPNLLFNRHDNMTDEFFENKTNSIKEAVRCALRQEEPFDIVVDIIGKGRAQIAEIGSGHNDEEFGIQRQNGIATPLYERYAGLIPALIDHVQKSVGDDFLKRNRLSTYEVRCDDVPLTRINIFCDVRPSRIYGTKKQHEEDEFYRAIKWLQTQHQSKNDYDYQGHKIYAGLHHAEADGLDQLYPITDEYLMRFCEKRKSGNREEAFKQAATILYLFNHMCPFVRGSAAGAEILAEAFLKELFPEKSDVSFKKSLIDFDAFGSDLNEFTEKIAKKAGIELMDYNNPDSQHFTPSIRFL